MNPKQETQTEKPFWLDGNFAPVFEEVTETKLSVTGVIPPELNGKYFRNGANPHTGVSGDWFIGQGMVHGVELKGGKATWYRNRYVQTALLHKDNPKPEDYADLKNSMANTHVIRHVGKIMAITEVSLPIQLTPTLDTIGAYTFDGKLNGPMTAHPKICPITGEMLFFGYSIMPPFLTYYRASKDGTLVQSEVIDVPGPTMMHDLNITENFVIFLDLPMVFDPETIGNGGLGIRFDESYGARLGVMPRNGKSADVRWFDIEPCYVFHTLNAYEDGDEVVLDGCRLVGYMVEGMTKSPLPNLYQWRINLKTGQVSESQVDDSSLDFPRVPDRKVGQSYRYGYLAEVGPTVPIMTGYHKYDMRTRSRTTHALKNGEEGNEAVFVPAASGTSEDDGYLMTYVYKPDTNTSDLLIMDASNMASDPVARIHLPVRVPAGFHGSWMPDA
jgi:carotenoid cleavage dioxygenase